MKFNFLKKKKGLSENPIQPEFVFPPDIKEQEFIEIYNLCKAFTMTSVERMYSLYQAVNYILDNNIEGDFVECGVWKGGSALLMATILAKRNIVNRKVILYDTFEGMPAPTDNDKDYSGVPAEKLLADTSIEIQESVWCYSSFEEVKGNLTLSGLATACVIMIKGKVEDTIPTQLPTNKIAMLRLDTDWYESTLHELVYLYPLLIQNGVLIIDDYGHWDGCRKAVDEYIQRYQIKILLSRIDNTGRIAIKNV